MQINPRTVLDRGIIKYTETTKVQQVGVDLSIGTEFTIKHGESRNINFRESIKLPDNMYALFLSDQRGVERDCLLVREFTTVATKELSDAPYTTCLEKTLSS